MRGEALSGVRAAALRWFEREISEVYESFELQYSTLAIQLFIEIAVAYAREPIQSVLVLGLGTGQQVPYLRSRLPDAIISLAETYTLDVSVGRFDLVLSYSGFRHWPDAAEALRRFTAAIAPKGFGYLVDFRRDIPPDIAERLIARLTNDDHRRFLSDQLAAASTVSDVAAILVRLGIVPERLAAGGLAGLHPKSPAAFALLQANDAVFGKLLQLKGYGFDTPEAAELVFHLLVAGPSGGIT
jgi:hypothetical protein